MTIAWNEAAAAAIAGIVLLAVLQIVYASWRNGISPMPASAPVRRQAARLLRELCRQPDGGVLVEAGSGWGTLALALAKRCPGWRIVGIENSFVPYGVSRLAAWLARAGRRRAHSGPTAESGIFFARIDLNTYDYSRADAVVCYLYPGAMARLGPRLAEQLKPGALIISICFAIPGRQADQVVTCNDLYRTPIYCYRID